jgi:hypothetical protein
LKQSNAPMLYIFNGMQQWNAEFKDYKLNSKLNWSIRGSGISSTTNIFVDTSIKKWDFRHYRCESYMSGIKPWHFRYCRWYRLIELSIRISSTAYVVIIPSWFCLMELHCISYAKDMIVPPWLGFQTLIKKTVWTTSEFSLHQRHRCFPRRSIPRFKIGKV